MTYAHFTSCLISFSWIDVFSYNWRIFLWAWKLLAIKPSKRERINVHEHEQTIHYSNNKTTRTQAKNYLVQLIDCKKIHIPMQCNLINYKHSLHYQRNLPNHENMKKSYLQNVFPNLHIKGCKLMKKRKIKLRKLSNISLTTFDGHGVQ